MFLPPEAFGAVAVMCQAIRKRLLAFHVLASPQGNLYEIGSIYSHRGAVNSFSCKCTKSDRLWLHVDKCTSSSSPEAPQQKPEEPIRPGEAKPRMPQRQRGELLPQCEVFEEKIAAGAKEPICQRHQERQQT